jgi:dolichol-phosphate mannosyltransferase
MKVMVTISTYNERDNIQRLLDEIVSIGRQIEVVVADDDSPDGTWKVVEALSQENPAIHLLHRKTNRGRGSAGKEAFHFAFQRGADLIVEMDGDFSHHPRFIPSLIDRTRNFDIVIGSRYVPGGKDLRKSLGRRTISRISTRYSKIILGVPVLDCNSGYRSFKRCVFAAIPPLSLASTGPSIVHELLYKAHQKGFTIGEVPIEFEERDKDQSKLTFGRLLQGLLMVMKIRRGVI